MKNQPIEIDVPSDESLLNSIRNKNAIADALRTVAMRLERSVEHGHRSRAIDSDDLVETMLAVADEIDPQVTGFMRDHIAKDDNRK